VVVVEHEVALAEGAALGVLSGETDGTALDEQRCEGQRFRGAPVDATFLDSLAATLQLRLPPSGRASVTATL